MTSSEKFESYKLNILNELQILSQFIYLMGSVGTERFTENSDIDIAVYWIQKPDFHLVFLHYYLYLLDQWGFQIQIQSILFFLINPLDHLNFLHKLHE